MSNNLWRQNLHFQLMAREEVKLNVTGASIDCYQIDLETVCAVGEHCLEQMNMFNQKITKILSDFEGRAGPAVGRGGAFKSINSIYRVVFDWTKLV